MRSVNRSVNQDNITQAFIDYMGDDTDERGRFLLTRLVDHLNDFVKETKLTHAEWRKVIELLVAAGEISDSARNEFVLFSDVLGVSSIADRASSAAQGTPSSVAESVSMPGPFNTVGAPKLSVGGDMASGNQGSLVIIGGVVKSTDGQPLGGAELDIWQTADNGLCSSQDNAQLEFNLRAHMTTGPDGRYLFSTVRPAPSPVRVDSTAGELLRATKRDSRPSPHLHFIVTAPAHQPLVTEVFPSDDPCPDSDAVSGVCEELMMYYKPGMDPLGLPDDLAIRDDISGDFFTVDVDFVLAPVARVL